MIIELTEPAQNDLENIKNYIKKDSLYYANVFVEKIFLSIEKLEIFPHIGRIVPEYGLENKRMNLS
ncbi:MAG: hypothetical protein A2086_01675 [Spirochaetes bacterium GWD1_27_9]|nr:MAG: hypothetical protein A2Z98_04055 [Spirochaetes bacterium GWB1_27_13]OHD20621.1 MAG: hypothetical protein A2Y34_17535 [Spirochaetes bacterium GWC1_27_15]OHD41812.1 MAG: hypothetical protein A2086_01675 [Spirochaetes bacterium GWD1_27_9]